MNIGVVNKRKYKYMEEKVLVDDVKTEEKNVVLTKKRIMLEKLKKIKLGKAIAIALVLFACYLSAELLSGNDLFVKLFTSSDGFSEKWNICKEIFGYVFRFPKFLANMAILVCLYFLIYGITNRTKLTCTIVYSFFVLFGMINYSVFKVRGISVTLSDIYSIRTAMNVAKGIRPNFEQDFLVAIGLYILSMVIIWRFCKFEDKIEFKSLKRKFATVFIGIIGMSIFFISDYPTNTVYLWNINTAYIDSGTGLTLVKLAKDLRVKKPVGYNKKQVKDILEEYDDDIENNVEPVNNPNVVVVMNESFSDLASIFNFESSEDVLPNYHEIIQRKNVVSGVMHSSQYGGGTANVEYEFLTENATAFLPAGAMPYQQYISKNVKQSIVTYMNKLGYNSFGMHSWYKNGYSRGKIYKFLQFDNYMFKEDMNELETKLNDYSTDISTYRYWFKRMDEKADNDRDFSFVVTMENHVPYNKVDLDKNIFVDDYYELSSYLQYEHNADEALKELIDYIDNYDEDIILLFFGDHQPALDLEDRYGSNGIYSVEESSQVVPFFIYANFDINGENGIETSANYLESLLLETAGLPLDSYTKYISDLRQEIPVINNHYYKDKDGILYSYSDKSSPYYEKMQEYWKVIYYQIFEK